MPTQRSLAELIEKYSTHPDFLGMEITGANHPGAVDDTMLHIAARTGAVEDIDALIAAGAHVDAAGDLGFTPLHYAAMSGHMPVVERLLHSGAKPDARNEFQQTASEVAEIAGHKDIVHLLRGIT
jgi:ankyrin repeat protein